ncbi:MAG: 5-(carboxyamino)imidazole ribonucleotide mutase [Candidatus Levybacteria bacterium]|nr:5-(carboxyamino)imidazole ribonucleotide mutase [Candidatus Levybacteria bacterium]
MKKPLISIMVGSDSDLLVLSDAVKVLDQFGVSFEITVSSAHRSPERTLRLVHNYYKNGVKVIIAAAGLAAHLAGVVAAHFPLPVIGVPLKGGALQGIDALYSTVQMPPGIPVATVGIDNAKNAGLLAVQILAVADKALEKKLTTYKKALSKTVEEKAKKLDAVGLKQYISEK